MTLMSYISLIQVREIMRNSCRESGLMMDVHQHQYRHQQQQQGGRKTSATSCHDDYLSGGDARRRLEPMKQSSWDKSIFHLFRARALPSVCPAMRRRSVSDWSTEPSGRWLA